MGNLVKFDWVIEGTCQAGHLDGHGQGDTWAGKGYPGRARGTPGGQGGVRAGKWAPGRARVSPDGPRWHRGGKEGPGRASGPQAGRVGT